jgi:TRAP-type C4-dicarboxylate transport system permease small subunit
MVLPPITVPMRRPVAWSSAGEIPHRIGRRRRTLVKFAREATMGGIRILAIALIVAGVLGLGYGSFTYTKETHDIKLGSVELSVKDKETVNIPVWAGIAAIVAGGLLLLFGDRKP